MIKLFKNTLLVAILLVNIVKAQSIQLSGSVYGFYGEKLMLMKKASKNLGFEGPLSEVKITIKGSNSNVTSNTDISGVYNISIPAPGEYFISISKNGYSTVNYKLNFKDAGVKSTFSLISFIIRKDDNSKNELGDLSIIDSGVLSYNFSESNSKGGNQDVIQSNKILIEKAVALNNSSKQNIVSTNLPRIAVTSVKPSNKEVEIKEAQPAVESGKREDKQTNDALLALSTAVIDTASTINDLKNQIEKSKQLLAQYNSNDPNYQLLLNQIKSAEAQLALKEDFLKAQEKELSQAKKVITFMVLMVIVAVLLIGFMFYYINEKKKFNKELSEKNTQITKINNRIISSIKYASVIQSNLLMNKDNIRNLFKNSFVFYQPKDFLSGDFYWFNEVNGTKIIIAADCTGHGVPGALLTILGHGIIEEIVEKKKLVAPSEIIKELNNQLNIAFSNQNLMEYGIELTVLCFPKEDGKAVFASNGHGIYKYSNGEVMHYLPTFSSDKNNNTSYSDVLVEYKKDDCFYLMSDGYCDQFKGESDKPEKFNLRRFESMLSKTSTNKDFTSVENEIKEAFVKWKGTKEQTDDVLVIGFKI
ncbi:MAG: SpoIIE family protein phosphatase [Bacteroidia bacterium]|nr:SpoIIE family protein phosphatase [Bacteroidia bacterium]